MKDKVLAGIYIVLTTTLICGLEYLKVSDNIILVVSIIWVILCSGIVIYIDSKENIHKF